jgi:hypothetical protein
LAIPDPGDQVLDPGGIGEPIWPGRRPDEIVECQRARMEIG